VALAVDAGSAPVYLEIGERALHLRELGLSDRAIARAIGVSDKTVAKSLRIADRNADRDPADLGAEQQRQQSD
jgi:ParB-like chromosome segregation protein Spo0J